MTPDVSIILINYNAGEMTLDCIESIKAQTKAVSYEIIVIDNASKDGSRERLEALEGIKLISNEENVGFGRANNLGIKAASGRNVLFLNNDTLLRNDAISILSKHLDANPGTGACGGNLFNEDGTPGWSYETVFPTLIQETGLFRKKETFNTEGRIKEVAQIIGADLMVRRSILEDVGGFSPEFFLYREETELCFRIKKAGYSIKSIPEAEITHFGGATVGSGWTEQKRMLYRESEKTYYKLTHGKIYCAAVKLVWALRKLIRHK